ALADEVAGLGREVRVERHEVGLAQERVEIRRGRGELPLDGSVGPHGVVVEDAHVEPERAAGDGAPDPPESHDAERLAVYVGAPEEIPLPRLPPAGAGVV